MARPPRANRHLLGLGLDAPDRHKRITRGEGFSLVGGSAETHERMTEAVIKTVEDLQRQGRSLHDAPAEQVRDLLRKHDRSD